MYLFLLQGMNYILPWVTMPYLVRVLGPDNFGQLSFAQALNQYFIFITDYGFNLSATREIALNKNNPEKVASIFFSVTFIRVVLLILCFLSLQILFAVSSKMDTNRQIILISFLAVLGNALFPVWLFQGLEVMRNISGINIFTKLLATVSIFIFIKNKEDLLLAATFQSGGFLLAGILGLISSFYYVKRSKYVFDFSIIKSQLLEGWHIFISMTAVSLYTNTNQIILGYISNNAILGYYAGAEKIIKAIQGVVNPVTQAIYPHISNLAENNKEKAKLFIRKITLVLGGSTLIISTCTLFFSKQIIQIVLGNQYLESQIYLKILSPLPIALTLSNIFGIQSLLTFGYKKDFFKILIFGAFLSLTLIFPLTFYYNATGTAFTLTITEVVITSLMFYIMVKKRIFFSLARSAK